jgi:hypothetical protein
MKKINKSFIVAALGIVTMGMATSCNNDDYLTVDHYDILPADQMFKTEKDAQSGLSGIYDCLFADNTYADSWNFKPQLFFGCHPTLDTQATGWDVKWGNQSWTSDDTDLGAGYNYSYRAIGRANEFLAGMESGETTKSFAAYKSLDGEAHALRAYFYMFLAENWGRVPMLATGETFITTPNKAAAETDDEMWDFIIADLKAAADELDWKPYNGEYGRCTKGMALSYLGEAYLWKAYKARFNGDGDAKSTENIKLAKAALEQVVNSGVYKLAQSFSTLWDVDEAWPKECVFQVVNDMGAGNYGKWDSDAHIFNNFFAGSTNGGGGWGSEYLSWELYFSYEKNDKRRDASMCTSPVPALPEAYRSQTSYGYNPFLQQKLGWDFKNNKSGDNNGYMFKNGSDYAPGIWTLKLWRCQRCQWSMPHSPAHFYYKRYAGVLFDYAECLFRLNGGDDATAWKIINDIRYRAFGNNEAGYADELNKKFTTYYKSLAGYSVYSSDADNPYVAPQSYPIPFRNEAVPVPDAKTYYTAIKNNGLTLDGIGTVSKPFTDCQPWEVALGQERRKEFSSEWNLKADLQRSDFLEKSIEYNYPKGVGVPTTDASKPNNWHYYRDWEFNKQRLVMPIPQDEILRNTLIKQNPGY